MEPHAIYIYDQTSRSLRYNSMEPRERERYTHTHMRERTYTCTHAHTCAHTHTRVRTHKHTHTLTHIYSFPRSLMQMHARTRTHIQTHTDTRAHAQKLITLSMTHIQRPPAGVCSNYPPPPPPQNKNKKTYKQNKAKHPFQKGLYVNIRSYNGLRRTNWLPLYVHWSCRW